MSIFTYFRPNLGYTTLMCTLEGTALEEVGAGVSGVEAREGGVPNQAKYLLKHGRQTSYAL